MGEMVFIAPLKKGMFLEDMFRTLRNGHPMEFNGAVVVHGNGIWNKQIWETSKQYPSGRKLGELKDPLEPAVAEALGRVNLVLYAKKHGDAVFEKLKASGYQPIQLSYESDKIN